MVAIAVTARFIFGLEEVNEATYVAVRIFLRRYLRVTLHSRRLHASQSLRAFQQHSSASSNCHNTKLRGGAFSVRC